MDGMSEEETLIAVELPVQLTDDEEINDSDSSNNEDVNPFNLKKCYVRLKRKGYIEDALKRGCTTFIIQKENRGRPRPKPIC